MSNKFKDLDIKSCTLLLYIDFVHVKDFDPNTVKIDEKSYKNIFIYCIGYLMTKDLNYVKIYSVNPLYLIGINEKTLY